MPGEIWIELGKRLLLIALLWGFWWVPGYWLHKGIRPTNWRAIYFPIWATIPFGMPNRDGGLNAAGVISQIIGYWMAITSLLILFGYLPGNQANLSFVTMGVIITPVLIVEEIWAWRRRYPK